MRYNWYEYIYCMIVDIVKEAREVLWSIYSCIQAYLTTSQINAYVCVPSPSLVYSHFFIHMSMQQIMRAPGDPWLCLECGTGPGWGRAACLIYSAN